jgi:hypothetical protein
LNLVHATLKNNPAHKQLVDRVEENEKNILKNSNLENQEGERNKLLNYNLWNELCGCELLRNVFNDGLRYMYVISMVKHFS